MFHNVHRIKSRKIPWHALYIKTYRISKRDQFWAAYDFVIKWDLIIISASWKFSGLVTSIFTFDLRSYLALQWPRNLLKLWVAMNDTCHRHCLKLYKQETHFVWIFIWKSLEIRLILPCKCNMGALRWSILLKRALFSARRKVLLKPCQQNIQLYLKVPKYYSQN